MDYPALTRLRSAILFGMILLLAAPGIAFSATVNASSLSRADIQAAVDSASAGDIILLPAGSNTSFSGTVLITTDNIQIKGQGPSNTYIKTASSQPAAEPIFKFLGTTGCKFSGVRLEQYNSQSGYEGLLFFEYSTYFEVFDCSFSKSSFYSVRVTSHPVVGVIHSCEFSHGCRPGLGYGVLVEGTAPGEREGTAYKPGDASWQDPVALGSIDGVYIEDCTFRDYRHYVASQRGARYVVRHCSVTANAGCATDDVFDTHGYAVEYRGTRKVELYDNRVDFTGPGNIWFQVRDSGDGVVFNNTCTGMDYPHDFFYFSLPCCPQSFDCGPYPYQDQPRAVYFWNNIVNGQSYNQAVTAMQCDDDSGSPYFVEGRDWFDYPMPGYSPLQYPHPLRQTLNPHISLSASSLQFSAVAGGSNPADQSFQISNSGGGTLTWSITDNTNWLSCSPESGTNAASISVSADQAGLSAGTYSADITITSPNADNSPQQIEVTFIISSPNDPLSASIAASPVSGQPPLNVNFSGSASGGALPYSYSWDFGDGGTSGQQNPSHTYSSAGSYTARLTVRDGVSNASTATVTINVSPSSHEVASPNIPNGPSSGIPNASYTFTAEGASCSLGHNVEYRFGWGDGTYSAWSGSSSASHAWTESGAYNIIARARCAVDTAIESLWSPAKIVQISNSSTMELSLDIETSSLFPEQGGTTQPAPGEYVYAPLSSIPLRASAKENYRFSKWAGDVNSLEAYENNIAIKMDMNKSITAKFFTRCGDVNGDLRLTPADSQLAFDIFLQRLSDPTEAQKENADVNCDGTITAPNITPKDAHAIFQKYLNKKELPGDCSCKSRVEAAASTLLSTTPSTYLRLGMEKNEAAVGSLILVPVYIENAISLNSFGFDLVFPTEMLNFKGVARTELTRDFIQVDGYEFVPGTLRIGGYKEDPTEDFYSGTLVTLVFEALSEAQGDSLFLIINTVDDLAGSILTPGFVSIAREDRSFESTRSRLPREKRYDH